MLSPKLETGKTMTPQCAPKFFFFAGLVAAELADGLDRTHEERMAFGMKKSIPLTLDPSPRLGGERETVVAPQSVFSLSLSKGEGRGEGSGIWLIL